MPLPSLFDFAVKAVAKGIAKEAITFDFILDTKSSNAIFRELLPTHPQILYKLDKLSDGLCLSEVDLKNIRMDKKIVWNLRGFNLISLSLGNLELLKKYFDVDSDSEAIDIIALLKIALNEVSQRGLLHLGLSGKEVFNQGWESEVSKLLPSLRSIDISSKIFTDNFRFSHFCTCFPNLRCLDISSTNLQRLDGLENLKNLEKLVMCDVEVRDVQGYAPLSELKNLRFLDVSSIKKPANEPFLFDMIPVVVKLICAKVCMENLEFLDCSRTLMLEDELKKIVECHPKLRVVAAIGIDLDKSLIPETIHVINFATPTSIIESLKYSISMKNLYATHHCLHRMCYDVTDPEGILGKLEESEIWNYLETALSVMRDSRMDEKSKWMALSCVVPILRMENLHLFKFSEMINIVKTVLDTWRNYKILKTHFPNYYSNTIIQIYSLMSQILKSRNEYPGQTLPDELLNVIIFGTFELVEEDPGKFNKAWQILAQINKVLSWEQHQSLSANKELLLKYYGLTEKMWKLGNCTDFEVALYLLFPYLKESEASRRMLIENGAPGKLMEQFEKLERGTMKVTVRVEVLKMLKLLMVSMSEEEVKKLFTEDVVKGLMDSLKLSNMSIFSYYGITFGADTCFLICSILCYLLTKNWISEKNREDVNDLIDEFCDKVGPGFPVNPSFINEKHFHLALTSQHTMVGPIRLTFLMISSLLKQSEDFWRRFSKNEEKLRDAVEFYGSCSKYGWDLMCEAKRITEFDFAKISHIIGFLEHR